MNDELTDLRARLERLAVLQQVGTVIHSSLDPREALNLVLREAVRLMRATSGSVVLFNPTTGLMEIEAAHGLPAEAAGFQLRVGSGITGWVARTGQPQRIGDVAGDPRYLRVDPRTRSELAVPLSVVGQVRGVLNVESDRADAFTADDQSLLEELAAQTARVIHNTWLYEQLRLKARLFEGLFSVGQAINSTLNLDEALATITREAAALMDARVCSLHLLDDSRQWLDLRASHGAGRAYLRKPRVSVEESLLGVVLRRKKPQQLEDVRVSARYQNADAARRERLASLLSVPLLFSGQAIGSLSVYKGRPHTFSNEEVRILSALADLSAIAIEKARLYERVVDVEEQLRQNEKLSALGLLAAEVAHEIRNPLTVMKMLYHSLDLRFADADPRAQDARIMGEKMELLNRIVEQVLDFARSTEPKLASANVNQIIEDLGLLTRHKLAHQGIKLVRRLDPALPPVQADATQLEQAFLNLTLNAVEAMPTGGRLTLTTRVVRAPRSHEPPAQIEVEFKDSGQGMNEEQRSLAFSSLLNTTKAKGTGLGLAIVRRVVETQRGKVRLASRVGRGTAITVTLPV